MPQEAVRDIEWQQYAYAQAGVDEKFESAAEEAAANYVADLLEGGQVLDEFIDRQTRAGNRNVLQKLGDMIRRVYRDIKAYLSGDEARAIRQSIKKLEAALDSAAKQAKENAKNGVTAEAREAKATQQALYHDATTAAEVEASGPDYSLVMDQALLDRLNSEDTVTVYRAMQLIDGELYPPMAAKVKSADGKKTLVEPTKIGDWYQADEHPELVKNGKFELDKGNGSSINAAYNPYFHTSASPLNDQFSSAYDRPNLVVVEGVIPRSELTSGYRAEGAKDSVGETRWHSGPVASQLKGDKARRVFLSRWFQAQRIMPDAEVAGIVAETLRGENISVPENVVTPGLRNALREAGVEVGPAQARYRDAVAKKNAAQGGGKLSIKWTSDGRRFVVIEEDILNGVPQSEWVKTVKDNLRTKFPKGVIVGNSTIDIDRKSQKEMTFSRYMQYLARYDRPVFADKLRSTNNADEILQATENWVNEALMHPRKDDIIDFARGGVLLRVGSNDYSAEVIVGHRRNEKLRLYDIINLTPTTIEEKKSKAVDTGVATKGHHSRQATSDNQRVPHPGESVKSEGKFSLQTPVEETKDLLALHNLTADKLSKALALGGFPMPSIAVTRDSIPHTNFGDITLVMNKSTVDPKADRRNTVYSADAWTPIFPSIEYEADPKAESRLRSRYYEMRNKFGDEATRPLYPWGNYAEDQLNRSGGVDGVIERAMDDTDMMKLFLMDRGLDVPGPVTEESVTRIDDGTRQFYDHFINALGKDVFAELSTAGGKNPVEVRREWWGKHGEAFETAYKDYMTKLGFSEEEIGNVLEHETVAAQTRKALEMRNYIRNGPETRKTTTNITKTQDAIRAAVDQAAYSEWLHELFAGLEKSRGIYNGLDRYTSSGNQRSFKATHYEVTLENIAKAMAAENNGNSRNVSGFHGVKSLRAGMAERFSSIAQMHEREGRLQHLTQEQADQINDALAERLNDILGRIYDSGTHGSSDNSFIEMDNIGETLMEVTEQRSITPETIKRVFKKYRYNLDNALAEDVRELLFDVSQMPVNIFEAKPERAVRFDEVLAAIVPTGTDPKLIQQLRDAGVQNITEYEKDNDAERVEKVNQVEGAKFSLKAFEDGRRFVDVETDQKQFDGLTPREMGTLATKIIKDKFAGKVVGIDNRVFVNGRAAGEYGFPMKKLDADLHEAKMRAAPELDNLLDAGTNFRTEPDGRDGHKHTQMVGDFRYFDTVFKVGNEYYSGVVNVMPVKKGLLLKDVTQIKNITQDISSSYGENPKSTFLRDASMATVPQGDGNVNYSLKGTDVTGKPKSSYGFIFCVNLKGSGERIRI